VVDSRRAWMQIHSRLRHWEPLMLDHPAGIIELPEFGLRCTLGDLYRHVPLAPGRSARKGRLRSR
jgi:hypothetical protein